MFIQLESSYQYGQTDGGKKMEIKTQVIGQMDNSTDGTFDIANRVYSRGGNVQQSQQVEMFSQKQSKK